MMLDLLGRRIRFVCSAHRISVVVINKSGNFKEVERHAHADLPRLTKADRHVRRRHQSDLQAAGLGAIQDLRPVDSSKVSVALKADADREYCGVVAGCYDFRATLTNGT